MVSLVLCRLGCSGGTCVRKGWDLMTPADFEALCRPLNLKYRALFGAIPRPADYHGGQDIYLAALRRAVEEEMPLDAYLQRRDLGAPSDLSDTPCGC